MKKTLIIGATTNASRYAYLAANKLTSKGHQIVNIGIKEGEVAGVPIEKPNIPYQDIDTVTLYIGIDLQPNYYNYILDTKPKRVIFNPGTENESFAQKLQANGIEPIEACTLVMLNTGQY
jgi:predicted CoA-binding protein